MTDAAKDKATRLAAALRDNLKRRKAQVRDTVPRDDPKETRPS